MLSLAAPCAAKNDRAATVLGKPRELKINRLFALFIPKHTPRVSSDTATFFMARSGLVSSTMS
jgi:hypothetical protein